jgi:drug/metabolite transporter (DMT)-like permease
MAADRPDSGHARRGIVYALGAAVVSGVAVFLNADAIKAFPSATVATTDKNLVAAVMLAGAAVLAEARRPGAALVRPRRPAQWWGLAAVAVIGGSIPFVLFFEGLAQATSVRAQFLHKTLVIWVALLALVVLRERLRPLHLAAVGLLVWGQAAIGGGVSGLSSGRGEAMILAATLLWAVEVVVAKRLLADLPPLTVALARMGGGVVLLVAWTAVTEGLPVPDAGQLGWALLTGAILAGYVACWYAALARAGALDVTAVLVLAAPVTALLDAAARGRSLAPQGVGLVLVAAGVALVAAAALRRTPARAAG